MICLGSGINPGTSNDDQLNWPASCLILSSLGLNALHRCFLLRAEVGGATLELHCYHAPTGHSHIYANAGKWPSPVNAICGPFSLPPVVGVTSPIKDHQRRTWSEYFICSRGIEVNGRPHSPLLILRVCVWRWAMRMTETEFVLSEQVTKKPGRRARIMSIKNRLYMPAESWEEI